jgi:sec-independent protein translocase protein TatB
MFEVGFSEMLLIAVLALVVLGPEKLPRVAAQVGRWVGRARAMARQFREQLEEEASLEATTRRPGTPGASSSGYAGGTPSGSSTNAFTPGATPSSATHDSDAAKPETPVSPSASSETVASTARDAQPPEFVASNPALEIDSNDTHHSDLSQSPATDSRTIHDASKVSVAASPVHERGT